MVKLDPIFSINLTLTIICLIYDLEEKTTIGLQDLINLLFLVEIDFLTQTDCICSGEIFYFNKTSDRLRGQNITCLIFDFNKKDNKENKFIWDVHVQQVDSNLLLIKDIGRDYLSNNLKSVVTNSHYNYRNYRENYDRFISTFLTTDSSSHIVTLDQLINRYKLDKSEIQKSIELRQYFQEQNKITDVSRRYINDLY